MPYATNGRISRNELPDGIEITESQYHEALSGMLEGKIVSIDDGFAVAVPPAAQPSDPEPLDLGTYAAMVRYQHETGGITLSGMEIVTDRPSQAMITGAYAFAQAHPTQDIDFKAASGWVTVTAGQMLAIGDAVAMHVQACFSAERQIDADIDGGTITTPEQIATDERWP